VALTRAWPEGWQVIAACRRRAARAHRVGSGAKPLVYVCGPSGFVETIASTLVNSPRRRTDQNRALRANRTLATNPAPSCARDLHALSWVGVDMRTLFRARRPRRGRWSGRARCAGALTLAASRRPAQAGARWRSARLRQPTCALPRPGRGGGTTGPMSPSGASSRSTITGAWSLGPVPLRAWRSTTPHGRDWRRRWTRARGRSACEILVEHAGAVVPVGEYALVGPVVPNDVVEAGRDELAQCSSLGCADVRVAGVGRRIEHVGVSRATFISRRPARTRRRRRRAQCGKHCSL